MSRSSHKKIPLLFFPADEPVASRPVGFRASRERHDVFADRKDTLDPAVEAHVEHFMRSIHQTFSGQELDISTPEQAQAAFDQIAELKVKVEHHLKLARSLKSLLNADDLPAAVPAPVLH